MEENKTPDKIEPTQNLDTNSRVIQPPISGNGINTTQIEPPKRQISQPQPTVAAQVQPQQIKTPPTYAGPQPKNPVVSYVPGGIYVIAAVMIAPCYVLSIPPCQFLLSPDHLTRKLYWN